MIRTLIEDDLAVVQHIHEQYYQQEFDFYDLFNNPIHKFVVLDNDATVVAGSIKTILEIAAVTDKSKSLRKRREALLELMDTARYLAKKTGHNELHVFVLDKEWERVLKRYGFKDCVGKALVYQE